MGNGLPQSGGSPQQQTPQSGPMDEASLRAQIAQWAAMPGADPSLANDPDYWVKAINDKGGLNPSNTQYWQEASVGPTAFFNNPNREQNGGVGGQAPPAVVPPAGQAAQNTPQMGQYQAPAAYSGYQPYNPATINQPGAVNPQQINASPTGTPGSINPQSISGPAPLSLGSIYQPNAVNPQVIQSTTVQGPQALQAQQAAAPGAFGGVSAADMEADPGYQVALKNAQGAIENSTAAQGIARGSNTWNALMQKAKDIASQQYQQTYANKFGEYQSGITNNLNTTQANNAANAQAYGLTNQYQQGAALANQQNAFNVGQANASNALNAGQFNAGMNYNTQAQNIQNQLAAYNAFQPLNQNAQQFNATQGYNAQAQNIQNLMNQQQFNSGQNFNAQQLNAANALNAGQFNAGMNFNTQNANQQNAFNANQANNANNLAAYGLNATTGLNAYNANVNNALAQGQLGLGYQQAANAYSLGQGQLGLGYANFGLNQQGQNYNQGYNTWNANNALNQQGWNNQYSLAQLGMQANGQLGAQGANYANNASNLYTGIGNAQGAGSIASGNAYANSLAALNNLGMYGMYYSGQQQQPQVQPNQGYSPVGRG